MLQLLLYLTDQYIGSNFTPIVKALSSHEMPLINLHELDLCSYEQLTDRLKYLIKRDIVLVNKGADQVLYRLQPQAILYFQRLSKYNKYLQDNFSKDQNIILRYLLEHRATCIDQVTKALTNKKNEEDKLRKVFMDLCKGGFIFEDEKASDLKISIRDQAEIGSAIEMKKSKSKKLNQDEVSYYTVSHSTILLAIRNKMIAQRLNRKHPEKSTKQYLSWLQDTTSNKYPPPLQSYSIGIRPAYQYITNSIASEIRQEYLFSRFGRNVLLVYKTLVNKPYIDENELMKLTLLEKKELGQALNQLIQSAIVYFHEVKVDRVMTLIYYADQEKVKTYVLEQLSSIALKIQLRQESLRQEKIRHPLKIISQEQLEKLEASLSQIDDLLNLLGY